MSQFLPYVFTLSCPISMGVMMWFMTRGVRDRRKASRISPSSRVDRLEREVQALRARQPQVEPVQKN